MFSIKIKNIKDSIVRQSIILSFIVFPAYGINFLFLIVSGRILESQDFGIFYTALSFINILIGPAVILNLFFARRITLGSVTHGMDGAISEFRLYVRYVLRWGGLLWLCSLFIMTVSAYFLGVESFIMVIVISISVYVVYITETTRAAFQGLKRFLALGIETLLWTIARFLLGVTALMLFDSVWAGLVGVAAAAIIIFFAFYYILVRQSSNISIPSLKMDSQDMRQMLLFYISYGLFMLIMYLDNIMAYISLDRSYLGAYSSACVLSKSIILLTSPIVQIFFPIMVEQNSSKSIEIIAILKTFTITLLLSCAAVCFILIFTDFISATIFGLNNFNASMIRVVAASAVPLCLLRVIVLLQLAKGSNKHALLLLPIVFLQMMILYFFKGDPVQFSWSFMLSCWGVFFYYGILCIPKKFNRQYFARAII